MFEQFLNHSLNAVLYSLTPVMYTNETLDSHWRVLSWEHTVLSKHLEIFFWLKTSSPALFVLVFHQLSGSSLKPATQLTERNLLFCTGLVRGELKMKAYLIGSHIGLKGSGEKKKKKRERKGRDCMQERAGSSWDSLHVSLRLSPGAEQSCRPFN